MAIYKNSLVERVMQKLGKEELNEYLSGPNAHCFLVKTLVLAQKS